MPTSEVSQLVERSERTSKDPSAANPSQAPHKSTNRPKSYLPEPKILRIQQRYIAGENKSEIARQEGCDRETVARIVEFPRVQQFVADMQQELYGLIPDALNALRHALVVDKNPLIAYRLLQATGVAPHEGERLSVPTATYQDGQSRQAMLVANLLLEGHENFNVDLPKSVEDALAQDLQEREQVTSSESEPREELRPWK